MPSRHRGSPREILALDTYVKLERATGAVAGALAPHLAAAGLSESQFGVLAFLQHVELHPVGNDAEDDDQDVPFKISGQ